MTDEKEEAKKRHMDMGMGTDMNAICSGILE